ncbi:protein of unknown function DUF1232 [Hymenobacter roseosalivarius DSM 11622]|uniref:DUF1232 domain-containing protein n=1 Tax=Hymenobacter roseosalivarius DSM 11622 TaxID=645990 RepID=A0A1W1VZR5_9BACT|nr:protein of unknown function DUF1232 [Hymenobacter roseosalivarius DSM 11622]
MSSLYEKGLAISKNALFNVFLGRAGKLLGRPFRIAIILREVASKLDAKDSKKGPLQQVVDMGRTLIRLIGAFASGSYRQIETTTIVSGLAVLLYVLSPIDLVPDFIPVIGFLDDLSLISWFISKFQGEIARFQAWESKSAAPNNGVVVAPSLPAVSDKSQPAVAELGHS